MPLYRIQHATTYRHAVPAASAWQTLRLRPRDEPGQSCVEFDLDLSPRALDLAARRDAFGNTLHVFSVREPHARFAILSTSLVRRDPAELPEPEETPDLGELVDATDAAVLTGEFAVEQFRHPSPSVPAIDGLEPLVADLAAGTPALTALRDLGEIFRTRFTFDPTATDIGTPLETVLRQRRGVCQDFAHLYLACVRHLGLAGAYVSGYLLTQPPAGQARLIGADAMHAWVSVFVPGHGWVDYDPTNHCFVSDRHVVVARGRDYSDIPPVHGLFNGGGRHSLTLGVTMEPVEEPSEP